MDFHNLIPSWIQSEADLLRAEAENFASAQKKYFRKNSSPLKWFEPPKLQNMHRDMFIHVWKWAGMWRQEEAPRQLTELCSEVKRWISEPVELTFLEQAAKVQEELLQIMPFQHGNERFARFVQDRYLFYWGRLGLSDPTVSELLSSVAFKSLTATQKFFIAKRLLQLGHDPNDTQFNGQHALQVAIKRGCKAVVLLLLQHNASITFRDISGLDPFETAIICCDFRSSLLLFKAGYPYKRGVLPPKLFNHRHKLEIFEGQYCLT